MSGPRIYLDHAATGWPKREAVYRAVETQMREGGAAAGRGTYRTAMASNRILEETRGLAARLFQTAGEGHFVFAANGTAALNMAIHGVLRPGDHVITTACEHNSVLRPLHHLQQRQGIRLEIVPCDSLGRVSAEAVLAAAHSETRLVVVTHGSNVTGAIQPVADIAGGLKGGPASQALVLLDAAQTAGSIPIDIRRLEVDLLATPGHKGLGGPLGTGLLYVGPRAGARIQAWMQGGTGSHSDALEMPEQLPDRLESGNQNTPAIAGLGAGLRDLCQTDLQRQATTLAERVAETARSLSQIPGVRVITAGQLPIVSLVFDAFSPQDVAAVLDAEFGIETRAGLHCAPRVHAAIGSLPGGTLRISFGPATGDGELRAVVAAIGEICDSAGA